MRLNNKGFTFVEILAVIVLIGILSSIAIVGVSRYKENAKNKDYEALAKSSYNAMEEYMMKNPYKKEATLETLDDGDFLSNRTDPATKNTNCDGSVKVEKVAGNGGSLDNGKYIVYLCCTNYKKQYTYPDGEVEDLTDPSKCDVEESDPDDYVIPTPLPGEVTYNITYNLNGGTVTGNPDKYSSSMLPFTIKNPTRSGYTFTGWTGTGLSNATKTVTINKGSTGNRTYTANWTVNTNPSYTVTLNNNGATTAGTASVKVQEGDTKLPTITNPQKVVTITYVNNVGATVSGGDRSKTYTLNGWYTAASSGSKVATNATTPVLQKSVSGYTDSNGKWSKKANTTLYAQWANVTANLPKVTKSGYTCKWTTSGGERASGGTWTFSSANARTFTAVCTANPKKVTITIKKGDNISSVKLNGKTSPLTMTVNSGTIVKITADAKDYYQVSGWYNGSTSVNKSKDVNYKVTSNITLTAKARKNKVILQYYSNGGHLTVGGSQICTKQAGCKTDECDWKADNDGCRNKTGLIYEIDHVFDNTSLKSHGLRNYAVKRTGTLYLTRSGYDATKNYHVGSAGSSTKIKEGTTYNKMLDLAGAVGKKGALKTSDVTIKLYAGWKND